jgi:hypothetical protein
VEVLKEGKLPEEDTFEGTCSHCKCRVRCRRFEAEWHSDFRDGDYYTVKCPTKGCPSAIYVNRVGSR